MIPSRLSTLGHPQRLALFRLLMRRYPDRVPATELARALDLKPNTLSTYIGALLQAGLVTQERVGTSLRYAVDMATARETFDYLLRDCCRGRPDICSPFPSATDGTMPRKYNVLFVCTGNSARSILAESILRHVAGDRFDAYSAGTKPRAEIHPLARAVLERQGHDIAGLCTKDVAMFQGPEAPVFDFVITVCNQAANEECPAWSGPPMSAHWGLPDPANAATPDAGKDRAFQQVYDTLMARITTFAALPTHSLDRIALQRALDDIATINEGAFA